MSNKKTIILLSGKMRAGKDYTAKLLKDSLNNSEILSFADPLKNIIAATFGLTRDELDILKNDYDKFPVLLQNKVLAATVPDNIAFGLRYLTNFREILQRFGTEGMKSEFGKDVWGELMVDKINKSNSTFIIVPDWRFLPEYELLFKKHNVITIKVVGKENDSPSNTHSSETALDEFNFDKVFDNVEHDGRLQNSIEGFVKDVA